MLVPKDSEHNRMEVALMSTNALKINISAASALNVLIDQDRTNVCAHQAMMETHIMV